MTPYLLDANTFMEASRLYYPFDFAPAFWDWLAGAALVGTLASVQAVFEEINKGHGPLVGWANDEVPDTFWLPDTADSLSQASDLATWANDGARNYKQSAVDEFMASADLRLIAQAKVLGATVVTREAPAPDSKKSIKIPDACAALEVRCEQPFQVYRTLGLKFT